jgi:microcystin-dependent protein
MEAYLAEIRLFAGNFAPRGWQFCNGQILSIAQNTALFALLGTTYGGNGQTTFALPDLRGAVPVGTGAGPGRSSRQLGQVGGAEAVTLTVAQMPAHNHALRVRDDGATTKSPSAGYLAQSGGFGTPATAAAPVDTVTMAGGGQPVPTMPPFVGLNYIICVEGIFPSRD